MLDRVEILRAAAETRLFATIRLKSEAEAHLAVEALLAGGVRRVELTLTTPGALNVIAAWQDRPEILVGAGSILNAQMARETLDAGARYLVSPHTDLEVVQLARERGAPVAPGAATATKMMTAWRGGADLINGFLAEQLGGPGFIKAILAPLSFLRLMVTGGGDAANAPHYLRAGAFCVDMGGKLVDPKLLAASDLRALATNAHQILQTLAPLGAARP